LKIVSNKIIGKNIKINLYHKGIQDLNPCTMGLLARLTPKLMVQWYATMMLGQIEHTQAMTHG
jgi:hypothetical protein